MRKLILLAAAGFMIASANAQNLRNQSIVRLNDNSTSASNNVTLQKAQPLDRSLFNQDPSVRAEGKKTGPGGSRWYSYTDYMDSFKTPTATLNAYPEYFWHHDNSRWPYGSPVAYDSNKTVSMGFILDPFMPDFNDSNFYPGQIAIGGSDNFVFDSVLIIGEYNMPKPSVVDTMIVSFFYGDGSNASNIHENGFYGANASAVLSDYGLLSTDTLFVFTTAVDSLTATSTNYSSGPTVSKVKIPFTPYLADTANGLMFMYVPVPGGGINIPSGGNLIGATYSFASGDNNFTNLDTVAKFNSANPNPWTYKYNNFRPWVVFNATSTSSTGTAVFPPYRKPSIDANQGIFKQQPDGNWANEYAPMWAWSNGSTGSQFQYPDMSFHISCANCNLTNPPGSGGPSSVANVNAINSVKVYPNPANDQVVISFTSAPSAGTTVSLVNMLGQVVNSQNVTNANVTFNVSNLCNGVYFYSIQSNGSRTTGRVVVAH